MEGVVAWGGRQRLPIKAATSGRGSVMTHDEALFEALAYQRYVGGTLDELRSILSFRFEKKRSRREDKAELNRLQERGIVFTIGKRWYLTPNGLKRAKGWAIKPEWQPTDAWILLPVVDARTTCLEGILGTMDWINRAWPSVEELHEGVNRLASAQLLKVKANTFTATRQSRMMYAKVRRSHLRGALDQQEALWQIMNCPCCGVRLQRVRWRVRIDDQMFNAALESYYKLFEKK